MPLKILEKPDLIYVAYRRATYADLVELRATLDRLSRQGRNEADIVVDLTRNDSLTDGEIAAIMNVAKIFRGTRKHLRIVAREPDRLKIEQLEPYLAKDILFYQDDAALLKGLRPTVQKEPRVSVASPA